MLDKVFVVSDQSRSFARRYFRCYFPWVQVIAKATGGYWGFASRDAYRIWRRQK